MSAVAAHAEVEPAWIHRTATRSVAVNPTLRCALTLVCLQTDQYMDPWRDVSLSLDPTTRDRHAYAGANPVGYVDTNGHCIGGLGFCVDFGDDDNGGGSGSSGGGSGSSGSSGGRGSSGGGGFTGGATQPDPCSSIICVNRGSYVSPGEPGHDSGRPVVSVVAPPAPSATAKLKSTLVSEAIGGSSWLTSHWPGGYSPGEGRRAAMDQWATCQWNKPHTGGRMSCINANDQWLDIAPAGGGLLAITRRLAMKSATTGVATRGADLAARSAALEERVALAIDDRYPGHVLGRNRMVNGREIDIELENAVIEVTIGRGKKKAAQQAAQAAATGKPVVVYGPNLRPSVVRSINENGGLATTNLDELLDVVGP